MSADPSETSPSTSTGASLGQTLGALRNAAENLGRQASTAAGELTISRILELGRVIGRMVDHVGAVRRVLSQAWADIAESQGHWEEYQARSGALADLQGALRLGVETADEALRDPRRLADQVGVEVDRVEELVKKLADSARADRARADLADVLAELAEVLQSDPLVILSTDWLVEATSRLKTVADVPAVERLLLDRLRLLADAGDAGFKLAQHYGLPEWPIDRETRAVGTEDQTPGTRLLVDLEALDRWAREGAAALSSRDPRDLPDPPVGDEPWLVDIVAQVALFLEVRLVERRLDAGVSESRDIIKRLMALMKRIPDKHRLTPVYLRAMSDVLLALRSDPGFLVGIDLMLAHSVSEDVREICGKTLQIIFLEDPLWRPVPATKQPRSPERVLTTLVERVRVGDVLAAEAMPILLAVQGFDGGSITRGACAKHLVEMLHSLGPLGAWIHASLARRENLPLTRDELGPWVGDGATLSPSTMLPFALSGQLERTDEGLLAVGAASEIVGYRHCLPLEPGTMPMLADQWWNGRYRTLAWRIHRMLEGATAEKLPSSVRDDGHLESVRKALRRVRESLALRDLCRMPVLERCRRRYIREHASKPFFRALDSTSVEELEEVSHRIHSAESELDDVLAAYVKATGDVNATKFEPLVRRACARVLETIAGYVGARVVQGVQLRGVGRESAGLLASELEQMRQQYKDFGDIALRWLIPTLVYYGRMDLAVPGEALEIAGSDLLPRCVGLWEDACIDPGPYARAFLKDCGPDSPLGHAMKLAEQEGRTRLAHELLARYPVSSEKEARRRLQEAEGDWHRQLAELQHGVRALEPEGLDEAFLLESAREEAARFNIGEAKGQLERLRERQSKRVESKAAALAKAHRLLLDEIDALDKQVRRSDKNRDERDRMRGELLDLEDDARAATDLDHLERVRSRLGEVRGDLERSDLGKATPELLEDLKCYGSVKRAGTTFGFIVPYHAELYRHGDIHFERGSVVNRNGEIAGMPDRGEIVEIDEVTFKGGHSQPTSGRVRVVPLEEYEAVARQVSDAFDGFEANLGVIGRSDNQALIWTPFGSPLEVASDAPPDGALVRFEWDDTRGVGRSVRQVDPESVNEEWRSLLRRIGTYSRVTPAPTGSRLPAPEDLSDRMESLVAGSHEAIVWVREVAVGLALEDYQGVSDAIDLIEDRCAESSMPLWWRMMFVRSHLSLVRRESRSVQGFLANAVRRHSDWVGRSVEPTLHWTYRQLVEFVEQTDDVLSLEDVYDFFKELQSVRGNRPHQRLELILAYLAERRSGGQETGLLELALSHSARALALNPRQSEAAHLRARLLAELGDAADWAEPAEALSLQTELPDDPVAAIQVIQDFYRQASSHSSDEVKQRFDLWLGQDETAGGEVRARLFLLQGQYLLDHGRAADAERVLRGHIDAGGIEDWAAFSTLLYETWLALRWDYDRVVSELRDLEGGVDEEARPHLDLVRAQIALDERRYEDAAAAARSSLERRASAKGRQLIEQVARLMPGSGNPADLAKTRNQALEELERADSPEEVKKLALSYLNQGEVGPWLVERVACGEADGKPWEPFARLTEDVLRDLVMEALARAVRPSVALVVADIASELLTSEEVRFTELFEGNHLQKVRELLRTNLDEPTPDNHEQLYDLVEGTGAAYATFAALSRALAKQRGSGTQVYWYRARAALEEDRFDDYFDAALTSIDAGTDTHRLTEVYYEFSRQGLDGLAFAVAQLVSDRTGERDLFRGSVERYRQQSQIDYWRWPAVGLQARNLVATAASRSYVSRMNLFRAMDRAIRVLLVAPMHWSACETFLEVFRLPADKGLPWGAVAIDLAMSVVSGLCVLEQDDQRPELLGLKAKLIEARAKSGRQDLLSAEVRDQVLDLCRDARKIRQGFPPIIQLYRDVTRRLEVLWEPGDSFRGIHIVEQLPEKTGSFGVVYKGKVSSLNSELDLGPDVKVGDELAIKVIRSGGSAADREKWAKALARDALITKLRHENIVRSYAFVQDPLCLVMEYLPGQTFYERAKRKLKVGNCRQLAHIGMQLADAFRYAVRQAAEEHGVGANGTEAEDFAHRDLHPGNIMLVHDEATRVSRVKVLDFGLARLPGKDARRRSSEEGVQRGSFTNEMLKGIAPIHYRDPDYPDAGPRGDMFSIGVILYEQYCSGPPFPPESYGNYLDLRLRAATSSDRGESLDQLRKLERELSPSRPRELLEPDQRIDFPDELDQLLYDLVAFDAADRPQSWDEVYYRFKQIHNADDAVGGE